MTEPNKITQYPHEPGTAEWDACALQLRLSMAPEVYPCEKCGAPVITGYRCDFCHDYDPSSKD